MAKPGQTRRSVLGTHSSHNLVVHGAGGKDNKEEHRDAKRLNIRTQHAPVGAQHKFRAASDAWPARRRRGTVLESHSVVDCTQAPAPLRRFGSVSDLRDWGKTGGAAAWRRAERLKHARWKLEVDEYRVAHGLVGDVE